MNTEERRLWKPVEEMRIVDAEGQPSRIEGLAVPYGELSEDLGGFRERVLSGAFSEALRSIDQHADVEHDDRWILARRSKGTLKFREDSRGLWASIQIPQTTRGHDVAEDVRNGNLDGMSIAWKRQGVESRFVREGDTVIREVRVAPLTAVTITAFPAYTQTADTLVLRSLEEWRKSEEAQDGSGVEETGTANQRRRLDLEQAWFSGDVDASEESR